MAGPGQLTVGMLFLGPNRNGLPVWSQPSGTGGLVYPQQPSLQPWFLEDGNGLYAWPLAYPSLYPLGCGHTVNNQEVFQAYDEYDERIYAYICCPLCSFIQLVMPVELYHDQFQTPLLVA